MAPEPIIEMSGSTTYESDAFEPSQAELDRVETSVNVVAPDDTDRAIADDQTPVADLDD